MRISALIVPLLCLTTSNAEAQDYSVYLPACGEDVSAEYRSGFLSYVYLSPWTS